MSTVVTTPLPKVRFQESKDNVTKHRDLVASREFERAIDYALLQYQASLAATVTQDFNGMASMGLRLMGAQEFVRTLRMLAESASLPDTKVTDNLNHRA